MNGKLRQAKQAKNDEFYTRMEDIEAEVRHYHDQFQNKVIYCNCDNEQSNFWKYFRNHFNNLDLKGLIATHYNPEKDERDFRSGECIQILEQADIVVTNPPFSLFRDYVKLLMQHQKKFLIIGSINAVTYKEFFPYLKNNEIRAGYTFNKTMEFFMPEDYELKGNAYIDENGRKHGFVPGICWYTNLKTDKAHKPLALAKPYDPERYPKYANYDAIECSRVSDIPYDYFGPIGVPVTFLGKYCPEQFEIMGISRELGRPMSEIAEPGTYTPGGPRFYLAEGERYRRLYDRIVIRRRQ